jgi:hypothetical protein
MVVAISRTKELLLAEVREQSRSFGATKVKKVIALLAGVWCQNGPCIHAIGSRKWLVLHFGPNYLNNVFGGKGQKGHCALGRCVYQNGPCICAIGPRFLVAGLKFWSDF